MLARDRFIIRDVTYGDGAGDFKNMSYHLSSSSSSSVWNFAVVVVVVVGHDFWATIL